jgi:hypothetical protein
MRTMLVVLAVTMAGTLGLSAHEGHTHVLMGTVTAIDGNRVEIQTKDAKKVSVILKDDTAIRRGNDKAAVTDLKMGERIVVDAEQEKDQFIAKTVRLAVPGKPAAKAVAKP